MGSNPMKARDAEGDAESAISLSSYEDEGGGEKEEGAEEDGEEAEFEIQCLVQEERQPRKGVCFLVQWKGFGPDHNSWEPGTAKCSNQRVPD